MKHDLAKLEELYIDLDGDTSFGDYVITVAQDQLAESPREWDNMCTMVCFGRHGLGDKHDYNDNEHFMHELSGLYEYEDTDYLTDEQLARCQAEVEKKNIILPLYLYDHSGITMNTTGYSCGWDSGQEGWIYISLEQVRKEYSAKRVSKKLRARVEKYLTGEVKTYDAYLIGDVKGFSIVRNDDDGDEVDVDSCWGFFGDDFSYMTDDIKSNIKSDVEHTHHNNWI